MNSFDLLLCSGTGRLSRLIKRAQKYAGYTECEAQISHVAVTSGRQDVFESTTLNKWCKRSGVQINPFGAWRANYNGKVWIRHININIDVPLWEKAKDWQHSLLGTPYESGVSGLIEMARVLLPAWIPHSTPEIHCSEAVAKVYQEIGWLDKNAQSNKLPPAMWWSRIDSLFNVEIGTPERIK